MKDKELKLKDQQKEADKIQPYIDDAEALMVLRKDMWDSLSTENRKKWLDSGGDPILSMEYNHYNFLKGYFGDL